MKGLQTFSPSGPAYSGDGCLPLEVLVDFRCESRNFDRLVPQADATFHYDKFNRLRLRNDVTSVARPTLQNPAIVNDNHLQNQTVCVPLPSKNFSTYHFI